MNSSLLSVFFFLASALALKAGFFMLLPFTATAFLYFACISLGAGSEAAGDLTPNDLSDDPELDSRHDNGYHDDGYHDCGYCDVGYF